jgi:hypothetical protein
MKKIMTVLMAVVLVAVSALACAEGSAEKHNFLTFETADGTSYDMFAITKLNYGEDHKVTSVTGHFERVTQDEEGMDVPETAPDSEKTYQLAADFRAEMVGSFLDYDRKMVPVTDLYQWFIETGLEGTDYDGHELVFACDLPQENIDMATYDFGSVITEIELNEKDEIRYMKWVYTPWG